VAVAAGDLVYSVPVTGTLAAMFRSRQSIVIGRSDHVT